MAVMQLPTPFPRGLPVPLAPTARSLPGGRVVIVRSLVNAAAIAKLPDLLKRLR
jgi:hypothetical protein